MGAGTRAKTFVLAAVVGALQASPARAQPAQPPQSFDAVLKMLDSRDLADRVQASDLLVNYSLTAIVKALASPDLSPEQRQRLRAAGQLLFTRSPRGALGVRFADVGDDPSTVVDPVERFDSQRVLRSGDALVTIDDHRITGQFDVRQAIISHDPGEMVTLGILRAGTPMTVEVKMGRLDDLGARPPLEPQILNAAWLYRLARAGEPRTAAVESPLAPEQWRDLADRLAQSQSARQDQMHDPFSGEPVRSVMNRPPVSNLALGGQTRDLADEETGILAQRAGSNLFLRGAHGNMFVRDQNALERDALRSQREQLVRALDANRARINDPATPEADKTSLKVINDQASLVLQAIDARIQQLSRVPDVRP